MEALAQEHTVVKRSQSPDKDFMYTPSVLRLENGRLLVSLDVSDRCGEIYASDDGGNTWTLKGTGAFTHARLFADGDKVYLIGHKENLIIFVSCDGGETWSEEFVLAEGQWHQSACSVCYKNGYIYLVMECLCKKENEVFPYWCPYVLAPVVMRGKLGTDLTQTENWLFSEKVAFRDWIPDENMLEWFGVPFFDSPLNHPDEKFVSATEYRNNLEAYKDKQTFTTHPIGWLETNLVEIVDPKHYWYDPEGKTLMLFMRAHTGGSGYCCVAKAVEETVDGVDQIKIRPVTNPSGKKVLFLPMPGGQMKFYITFDSKTKLYWLLSTQATDTMCRIEYLDAERYNIPCDERERLTLHFSKNMVDWVFAGLVAKGDSPKQSRHYGSMDIDGEDLVIVSRSGDADSNSAHNGNLITFHRVKNFRNLIY